MASPPTSSDRAHPASAQASGSRPNVLALNGRLRRLRPADYDDLTSDAKRLVDSVLLASLVVCAFIALLVPLYLFSGSGVGLLVMLIVGIQPILSIMLLQRGQLTGAAVVLALWTLLSLNGVVLASGGTESTTNRWYVVVVSLSIFLLPARLRVGALLVLLANQLGMLYAMHQGWQSNLSFSMGRDLWVDSSLTLVAALLFGRSIALSRRMMLQRLARTESDLTIATQCTLTGFIVVDRQGQLSASPSAEVQTWLGGGRRRERVSEVLARRHSAMSKQFQIAFEALLREEAPEATLLARLPTQTAIDARQYRLRHRLWRETPEAPWSQLVTTIEDITESRQREFDAVRRQVTAVFIRMMQQDAQRAASRFEHARMLGARILTNPDSDDVRRWAEELHTLTIEDDLNALACIIEYVYRAPDARSRRAAVERMRDVLAMVDSVVYELWNTQQRTSAEAPRTEYNTLLALIRNEASLDVLKRHTSGWARQQPPATIHDAL